MEFVDDPFDFAQSVSASPHLSTLVRHNECRLVFEYPLIHFVVLDSACVKCRDLNDDFECNKMNNTFLYGVLIS